ARAQAEEVANTMTYFELIAEASFMDEFSAGLFLPHTDLDLFPSVKAELEKG
ncbi:MAG: ASKHA domain-containing protein, partial [Dehalococcoidia bacterium]